MAIDKQTPMTWKPRLRALPKPRPMLKQLAKLADRHPSLISDYVNGERSPSMQEIAHIELACQKLIAMHKNKLKNKKKNDRKRAKR